MSTHVKLLFDLLKQLTDSWHSRRKSEQELLDELYERLRSVHAAYIDLFLSTQHAFMKLSEQKKKAATETLIEKEVKVTDRVRRRVNSFARRREIDLWIRDNLRENAALIFFALSDSEQKRFVWAVMDYFWRDYNPHMPDEIVDFMVEHVEEDGGPKTIRTPSSRLLAKMRETDEPKELAELVGSAIDDINARFSVASSRHLTLKLLTR